MLSTNSVIFILLRMAQQVYIFNQGGGGEGRRYIPTRGSLPLECVGQRGHDFRTIDEERGVCNREFRETVHRVSKVRT